MKKSILTLILSLTAICSWADDSGTCGENLTWTYVESTQTLTISGTGNMYNYNYSNFNHIPWYNKGYRSSITKVIIEKGVTSIGQSAFRECTGLTSITIPNSVTSIGNAAFCRCTGMTSIEIPNSVTSIGSSFQDCTGLKEITIPNSVTSIGSYAFSSCTGLTSITIPNSVTSIGNLAFNGCTELTEIEIPNSVTSIGDYAFEGTAWYNNQSDGMVYAGNVAYHYKGQMPANTHIQLKEGTVGISNSAFNNCSGLKEITIPNSVTSIGDGTFSGCTGLTSITIPNSVTSIGESTFSGCSGLKEITIPNSVTCIGSYAFSSCTGLTSITIPYSVTSIGSYAFRNCTGLATIEIPNSVTSIGEYAFSGCQYLTEIHISDFDAWCKIQGAFRTFQNAAPHYLILNAERMKDVVVASDVESITSFVFESTIGIETLTVLAKRPPTVDNYFASALYESCTLYVPEGSENAYYVAEGWKNFKKIETIKEQQPQSIPQDVNGDGVVDTQDVLEIYKYIQEH